MTQLSIHDALTGAARKAAGQARMEQIDPFVLRMRVVVLRSNPGEVVWTPFMGVGSEVYGAIINGRQGLGAELKPAYYKQARRNLDAAANQWKDSIENEVLFKSSTSARSQ